MGDAVQTPVFVGSSGAESHVLALSRGGVATQVGVVGRGNLQTLALSPGLDQLGAGLELAEAGQTYGSVTTMAVSRGGELYVTGTWYLRSPVTAMEFGSSGLVAAGCRDGGVAVFRVGCDGKAEAAGYMHDAPVASMCHVEEERFVSVSADGVVREWRIADLPLGRQWPAKVPWRERLCRQGAVYVPSQSSLAFLAADGTLQMVRVWSGGTDNTPALLRAGRSSAVTLVEAGLVVADEDAPILQLLGLPDGKKRSESSCRRRVKTLARVSEHEVVAIDEDGEATIWETVPGLHATATTHGLSATCAAQVPTEWMLRRRREHVASVREAALGELRDATAGDTEDAVRDALDRCAGLGLEGEALILVQQWCRARDHVAWEVQVIERELALMPPVPLAVELNQRLAELLVHLGRPGRAGQAIERVLALDPGGAKASKCWRDSRIWRTRVAIPPAWCETTWQDKSMRSWQRWLQVQAWGRTGAGL